MYLIFCLLDLRYMQYTSYTDGSRDGCTGRCTLYTSLFVRELRRKNGTVVLGFFSFASNIHNRGTLNLKIQKFLGKRKGYKGLTNIELSHVRYSEHCGIVFSTE